MCGCGRPILQRNGSFWYITRPRRAKPVAPGDLTVFDSGMNASREPYQLRLTADSVRLAVPPAIISFILLRRAGRRVVGRRVVGLVSGRQDPAGRSDAGTARRQAHRRMREANRNIA